MKSSVNLEKKKEKFFHPKFEVKSSYQGFNENKENRVKLEKQKKSRFNKLTKKIRNFEKEGSTRNKFRISKTYKQRTGSIHILNKYPKKSIKNSEKKNYFFNSWKQEDENQEQFGKFVKNKNRAKQDLFHLLGFDDIYQTKNFKNQVEMVKEGKLRGGRSNFKLLRNLELRRSMAKNHNSVSTLDTRDREGSKLTRESLNPTKHALKSNKRSLNNIVISRNKWRKRAKRDKAMSFTSSTYHKLSAKSTKVTLDSIIR